MTNWKLFYVVLHVILATACMVVGAFIMLRLNLNPTKFAGALLCAAGAALIFHAAVAIGEKK